MALALGSDTLKDALKDYCRVVQLRPNVVAYRLLAGKIALELGEDALAATFLRGAMSLQPNFADDEEIDAMANIHFGNFEAATAILQQVWNGALFVACTQ